MIRIVEVGPRDGLQNEKKLLSVEKRIELVERLILCGLKNIEIGAFVSSAKIPQMQGSREVVRSLFSNKLNGKKINFPVLVPNEKGMQDAIESGAREVSIFTAASEKFNLANINCSIRESFNRFEPVMDMAYKNKIKVRGYLSAAFFCPYEGKINPKKVIELTNKLLSIGCYEVSIGDTLGYATPKNISQVLKLFSPEKRRKKIAMHLHDTKGMALANTLESLNLGIRTFDSSVAGLGGCPYAPGAKGNVATENLVYMLNGMGYRTGVDYEKLLGVTRWISKELNKNIC